MVYILYGISRVPFEIPHKISYPHIETCNFFYKMLKFQELSDLRARKQFWNPTYTHKRHTIIIELHSVYCSYFEENKLYHNGLTPHIISYVTYRSALSDIKEASFSSITRANRAINSSLPVICMTKHLTQQRLLLNTHGQAEIHFKDNFCLHSIYGSGQEGGPILLSGLTIKW